MELKEVFEPILNFLKNFQRKEKETSKDKAKERLQLVLMQDRASVSPDFFEMMKKEIIEVIKKYIEIDEETLEVQLTRGFEGEDGTGPALYANIPIKNIKPVARKIEQNEDSVSNEEKPTAEELANTIIDEIKVVADEKQNKNSKNKKKKNNNNQKQELVDEISEEIVEEVTQEIQEDSVDTIETTEEVVEELKENIEEANETKSNFKEKLTDVKAGVQDTFTKVKTSAKEGIEKIKSKVKAKN